jgi:hypothetical protein
MNFLKACRHTESADLMIAEIRIMLGLGSAQAQIARIPFHLSTNPLSLTRDIHIDSITRISGPCPRPLVSTDL